ncbi:MAG: hypothetical protein AAFX52_11140 [Pseudomonadota bacterium]
MTVPVIIDRQTLEAAIVALVNRPSLTGQVSGFVRLGETLLLTRIEAGRGHENNPSYREVVPALGENANDTTWLLIRHPALYLNAALIHFYKWAKDDQRAREAAAVVESEIGVVSKESRRVIGPLRMTHDYPTDEPGISQRYPQTATTTDDQTSDELEDALEELING